MVSKTSLIANVDRVRRTLPHNVTLAAVTKHRSIPEITELLCAGVTVIAENRIQEAKDKFTHLPSQNEIPHERHFIGHLQTNKVKDAVRLFDCIQSVDSVRLAQKINTEAAATDKVMPVFLQVNGAGDPNKHGLTPDELPSALESVRSLPHLNVRGLMTIMPLYDEPENARPHFRALRALADTHHLAECSMGMSRDYGVAVEEGATLVRLGTILFEGKTQTR